MSQSRWGILLVVVLLAAGLFFQSGWFENKKPSMLLDCPDLTQGCQFAVNGANYRLQSTSPISGGVPFVLDLIGPARQISASWQMQGMEMGPNQYRFMSHISKGHQDNQQWQVKMALPLCTQARSDWLLTLQIDQHEITIKTLSGRR
ncbi:hypothetical protein [Chitinibacter sp. S2-10]|uniref:hypothetical protein n=1 Tax=Chitinibacter sp. S2-10 TaxID=3373597 RepID=UPI0039777190